MVFEQIEKLKDEYTDKFVVVDETRPELRRFMGQTGTVRTVNMSGRALVEFDSKPNIGWFDIDIDFLKVVDAPVVEEEAPKAKAKPKPKAAAPKEPAAASELEKARSKKAASEMSVEEMLAAARGGAKPEPKKEKAPPAAEMSVDDILAAARGGGKTPAPAEPKAEAKSDSPSESKPASGGMPTGAAAQAMSVEEMLAAARGKKAPVAESTETPVAEPEPEPAQEAEPVAEEPEPEPEAPAASGDGVTAEQARAMSVEEAVAYCRKTDS